VGPNSASEDIGRVAAALLQNPAQHAGQTYPLFGPVEMNHEQIAAELTIALGRPIIFQNVSIDEYCSSLEVLGVPEYVVQHFRGAMDDYQHGVMSGMNDNVERLSGQKPRSVVPVSLEAPCGEQQSWFQRTQNPSKATLWGVRFCLATINRN
jgi:NAD(P)H dehydrogenase (quinone)